MAAGIDDIAIYIPQLYVEASDFARERGLDPVKLERGLGIGQMAIVDTNQDPACLAANACLKVMQKNKLTPDKIGRLYVATESSFDESKAMNSYVIGMLEQVYGQGSFEHCGGVETKFACVRYGNVLGSRGSIIPKFIEQIVSGSKITITDPNMTRFNITMDQALDLIFRVIKNAIGGDIHIPKLDAYKVGDVKDVLLDLMNCKNEEERIPVRVGEKWNLGLFIPTHGKFGNIC